MGMYTEINVGFNLCRDCPHEVIRILKHIIEDAPEPEKLPDHILFAKDSRWRMLGLCCSYYFSPPFPCSKIKYDETAHAYCVAIRANLKNYGNEIELFIDWLTPYIDATDGYDYESDDKTALLGYQRYEESPHLCEIRIPYRSDDSNCRKGECTGPLPEDKKEENPR